MKIMQTDQSERIQVESVVIRVAVPKGTSVGPAFNILSLMVKVLPVQKFTKPFLVKVKGILGSTELYLQC